MPTAGATHEFGRTHLAPLLEPGDLLIASGPLGVGKTALVQGIGAGLRVEGAVLSPTFVIARVHRGGRIPLVHVDAYRLGSVKEIDDLDLDAVLAESVTVVEWGEGLVEQLTDEHLLIELSLPVEDAGSLHNRPFDRTESAGSLQNRPVDRTESAGSLHNRPLDEQASVGDEVRTATLTPYGSGWQTRLPAILGP
ncbi:MAG: tRNA (adenosine(37)-N6)-threonylcarbamoyltransferase complex ATPase subunit type 1 TsaE [Actinomycetota bacterium]|nr:tRNA (adenosine(37)-N6)-threonylcarbamoyltransferase complex ATPase subunit type 1 TsaE [Actinomycetota bacterium]